MINSLDEITLAARQKGRKRLVVAYAEDVHTLEAVNDAVDNGIVDAFLIGDPDNIEGLCRGASIDPDKFTIIPADSDVACVNKGVRMVSEGQGDILMKGLVSSDKYMRGILSKEYGLVPTGGVVSHVCVIKHPAYHKLLLVSDVAIIPNPTLQQKTAIINYLVETAKVLDINEPKIACISPSEQILTGISSSTESAILAKMSERGQFGNAIVDGPLALDVALFEDIVKIKKLKGSSVAGDADCLLFPNLDSANTFFKCSTQLSNAELACMVVGARVPCVLTSRGDTRAVKLNSIALACLCAK